MYKPNVWNAQSILLGGLGRDPKLDENIDPLKLYEKNLIKNKKDPIKVNFFDANKRKIKEAFWLGE
jgi:hypothetical protein